MANPFILITPSTRGISLALTRHFLQTTTLPVFATYRSQAGDSDSVKQHILSTLPGHDEQAESKTSTSHYSARLHLLPLDLTIPESIEEAASLLETKLSKTNSGYWHGHGHGKANSSEEKEKEKETYSYLHTGFFTGGVLHVEKRPQDFDVEKMRESFQINTFAHMLLMKHFERFLPRKGTQVLPLAHHSSSSSSEEAVRREMKLDKNGSKEDSNPCLAQWVHITARVGSIADNHSGGWYSYRASKAALAQLVRTFDHHLRMRSVPAIALGVHPGTVRTELAGAYVGGAEKRMEEGKGEVLDAEEAARRLVGVVGRAGKRERGMVWDHRGERVPW